MKFARTVLALSVSAACLHAAAMLPVDARVAVDGGPHAVASDPLLHRAFVTNRDTGTVSFLDLLHAQSATVVAAGASPAALLSDAATSRLYVLNDTSPGTLTIMNAQTGDIVAAIELGDRPQSMAADFTRGQVYVSNTGGSLSIVDVNANRVLATLPMGRLPQGVGVDAARGRIYVSNTADATVSIVDRDKLAVIATVAVGRNPGVPVVDPLTGRVFVNAVDDRALSVLDGEKQSVIAAIASFSASATGSLSPVYRKLYLPSAANDTVSVIDLDALAVTAAIPVGRQPQRVTLDEDSGSVYVPNLGDANVSVIDARSSKVAHELVTGERPAKVELTIAPDTLLVVSETASAPDAATFARKIAVAADTAIAVEYSAPDGDRFFSTADPLERRLLDDGVMGAAWQRTQTYWRVWTAPQAGTVPVCRFASFSSASGASQVYAYGTECDGLKATLGADYEMIAYYVAMPDADGGCPAGSEALFRLVRRDAGGPARYRMTPDSAVRDAMQAGGWVAEGAGASHTFACTPSLRGAATAPDAFATPGIGSPPLPRFTPWPIELRPRPKDAGADAIDAVRRDRLLRALHRNEL